MLVTRQVPWKRSRFISAFELRRSALGNGAGANAVRPTTTASANVRRTIMASLPLRFRVGDDRSAASPQGHEVALTGRVEGRTLVFAAVGVEHLHVVLPQADEAHRVEVSLLCVEVEVHVGRP